MYYFHLSIRTTTNYHQFLLFLTFYIHKPNIKQEILPYTSIRFKIMIHDLSNPNYIDCFLQGS